MIKIPVYNKSYHNGKGDREAEGDWRTIQGPIDLVIIEGWMLGYTPVSEDNEVIKKNPGMEEVNKVLQNYALWDQKLDASIIVTVPNTEIVYQWREEAEEKMRQKGQGAMTKAQVIKFCDRFMPSYDAYMNKLYK